MLLLLGRSLALQPPAVLCWGPGAQNILSQPVTSPGALVREVGAVPAMALLY